MDCEQPRAGATSVVGIEVILATSSKEEDFENIFRSYTGQIFRSSAKLGGEMFGLGSALSWIKGIVHYLNIRCHGCCRQLSYFQEAVMN